MTTQTFIPKTTAQILAKMKSVEDSVFDFTHSDLLEFLPFEEAKPFLKEDVTREQWIEAGEENTEENIKRAMLDYMPFAWEKANDCRGLSAMRSLDHMSAWLWLLGESDLAELIQSYDLYGKPQLRAICEKYGWDWREWDNGKWVNGEYEDGNPAPETLPETLQQAIRVKPNGG